MKRAALLLLPNLLGDQRHHTPFLPASVDKAVATIDGLISESASGGRRFLSRFETTQPTDAIPIALLNTHTKPDEIDFLLEPMVEKQERWGLISDAGLPCIADPGHLLVMRAKQLGIPIYPFIGPTSLTLALMLSGLPGQRFAFHGYLPKEPLRRCRTITDLERRAAADQATQIFIEAPHRNGHLLDSLLTTLAPTTFLSLAWDLTLPSQGSLTHSVATWKKSPLPNLTKRCVTFLLYPQIMS